MKSDFKLKGLSKPHSMTCEPLDNENIFWPKVDIPQDRFSALFEWASTDNTFWQTKWIAEIEHDGFYKDGTPINPIVVAIK